MGFKVILSKELKRVFGDKKMVFSLFILPIILIAGIYGMMFFLVDKQKSSINEHVSEVFVQNMPDNFSELMSKHTECNINVIPAGESADTYKDKLLDGTYDLVVVFPENFYENFKNADATSTLPDIKTFYNPSEDNSGEARTRFTETYLEEYKQLLLNERFGSLNYAMVFSVDADNPDMIVQDDGKATGKILGTIIPYLITILIFGGAMGLGVDTIAGEKERGTIANLLISPIKRVDIIMGKIAALAIVSVLSAGVYVISFIGSAVVLSKKSGMGEMFSRLSLNFTSVQIVQFVVLLLGLVLLYVGIIGFVSLMAKNIKEAQSFIMPVYIIVMFAGMITMYSGDVTSGSYMIPVYNTSAAFKGIFERTITMNQYLTSTIITYAFAGVMVCLMAKAMNSEKIMLNA
ncbi:MAG: ABC transporter permease [Butyrivibrio crossotus]|nr:ABC transporter permease [Oscillospiraceae bacterium]MBD9030383.1 ABC transporter permease [Butyrivibrio crossotus]